MRLHFGPSLETFAIYVSLLVLYILRLCTVSDRAKIDHSRLLTLCYSVHRGGGENGLFIFWFGAVLDIPFFAIMLSSRRQTLRSVFTRTQQLRPTGLAGWVRRGGVSRSAANGNGIVGA